VEILVKVLVELVDQVVVEVDQDLYQGHLVLQNAVEPVILLQLVQLKVLQVEQELQMDLQVLVQVVEVVEQLPLEQMQLMVMVVMEVQEHPIQF
tara:strand:+ start:163 stop:444 length:282 start_codon:yes stop_codon:yes gene_type:complete